VVLGDDRLRVTASPQMRQRLSARRGSVLCIINAKSGLIDLDHSGGPWWQTIKP
jgi:hypothetical protein